MHVDFLRLVKGGLFLIEEPFECVLSVYTNSKTATVSEATKTQNPILIPLSPIMVNTSSR